jgi:oligopeptide transport system substrate-binding protein
MTFIDMFTSKSGNNNTNWSDSQYDKFVADAKTNSNEATRMKDMHSAEKILMDNWVIIPVYYYTDPMLVSKNIQGFVQSALGFKYLMWTSVK